MPDDVDLGRAIRRIVEKGVAVSTGGAHLHGKTPKVGVQPVSKAPDTEVQDAEPVGSAVSPDIVPPTQSLPSTAGAIEPVGAVTTTSSRRFAAKSAPTARAAPTRMPALTTPVRSAQVIADKVVAAQATVKEVVDTVALRVADPIASTGKAVQTRVTQMMAAEPLGAATPATVSAPVTVASVVSGVLAAFGFGALATNSPLAPVGSPVALALLAWGARRETEQAPASLERSAATTSTTTVAAVGLTAAPAAVVATPVTTRIGWVTGANSLNDTVNRFGIAGTDVGVMWDNGVTKDNPATTIVEQREVLMAFGDTFSGAGMTGTWRMNTLFRSADHVLSDGLYIPDGITNDPGAYSGSPMTYPNFSREIIGNYHYGVGPEVTIIPTAGISVAGAGVNGATRQYVNFMAVKSWDSPGYWTTNYSAIAYSDDNGQNWTVVPASSVRSAAAGRTTTPYVAGNQNFQQGAYVKPPAGSPEAAAGWVYSYGTPAGRGGTVYVSRVNQNDILDQTKYQYWNGSTWVANKPSAATPILPGTTTSSFFGLIKKTTYPTAGELSVQYNPYLKKYVMLYTDGNNNVVMRTSSTPQGTWSAPNTLVTSTQYPGLYAPMIHPWSGTDQLKKADGTPEDPQYLYWGLSQWNEYNVALMRTDLSRV